MHMQTDSRERTSARRAPGPASSTPPAPDRGYAYLDLLTAVFASITVISGTIAGKIFQVGSVTLPGSAILFPVTYIFGDILTEVYGYRRARRVIWIGLLCSVLSTLTYGVVAALPPAVGFEGNEAFVTVLGQVPRIAAAGWIAFFLGENANSVTLSLMKKWTRGRHLWARMIGSTVVGEFVDTVIFFVLAFSGVLSWDLLTRTIVYLYAWKVIVEIVLTPATYRVVAHVKRVEALDVFDHGEHYNPFRIRTETP
jgi:queuosine precursor transporter